MKRIWLIIFIFISACSKSENDTLQDVSGVWSENGNDFLEVRLDLPEPYVAFGLLMMAEAYPKIPVSNVRVDTERDEVSFTTLGEKKTTDITLRKIYVGNSNQFTLLYKFNFMDMPVSTNLFFVRDAL